MVPEPITIDGKTGMVVYINDLFVPVTKDKATMAKVLFDDGTRAFYKVSDNSTGGFS
jgi:hypothetical protein